MFSQGISTQATLRNQSILENDKHVRVHTIICKKKFVRDGPVNLVEGGGGIP